jgi:hypothetical protein
VRHAALWLMGAIVAGLVLAGIADSIVHRLAGFLQIIVISLFLSFAIEPAVDYLAKRGWRRGSATGLVFLAVFVAIAALIALLIPAVVSGTRQLISSLPDLVNNLARYLGPFGVQLDQAHIEDQLRKYGSQLLTGAGSLLGGVVRVATGIVGGIFQLLTIALFTFYMAYGRYYEVVEDDTVAPALTPEKTTPDRGSRPRWPGRGRHNPPTPRTGPRPETGNRLRHPLAPAVSAAPLHMATTAAAPRLHDRRLA